MFSVCFSILECPHCGEALPAGDLVFPDEPLLIAVTCESCGGKVEVRKNESTGEMVAQIAKPA